MPRHDTDADTVAAIARTVPGVVGLHPGMFGEVATYLPGRRVTGVRVTDDLIDVHLVIEADAPVRDTAAAVRQAVAGSFPAAAVNVTVEDIASGPRRPGPVQPDNTRHNDTGDINEERCLYLLRPELRTEKRWNA